MGSSDYHASFEQLTQIGVLDAVFARRMAKAAGLRNRLVHVYDDLDQRLLFSALAGGLDDVRAYVNGVPAFLKTGR